MALVYPKEKYLLRTTSNDWSSSETRACILRLFFLQALCNTFSVTLGGLIGSPWRRRSTRQVLRTFEWVRAIEPHAELILPANCFGANSHKEEETIETKISIRKLIFCVSPGVTAVPLDKHRHHQCRRFIAVLLCKKTQAWCSTGSS